MYNFHLAGVVQLDPLAPRPAGDQLTNSKAHVYCNETNSYDHHPAFPGLGASSRKKSSWDSEASPCCVEARE